MWGTWVGQAAWRGTREAHARAPRLWIFVLVGPWRAVQRSVTRYLYFLAHAVKAWLTQTRPTISAYWIHSMTSLLDLWNLFVRSTSLLYIVLVLQTVSLPPKLLYTCIELKAGECIHVGFCRYVHTVQLVS